MTQEIKISSFKGLFGAYMLQSEKAEAAVLAAKVATATAAYIEWQQFVVAVTIATAAAVEIKKSATAAKMQADADKAAAEKAARKAATDARKERQAAAAKAATENRRNITAKTAKAVNMIDGEYEIPIEAAYSVKTANAAETRSIAVYGGKRLKAQAFEIYVAKGGKVAVLPQIQEQADCLQQRAGFMPEAKYQLGYSLVGGEVWLCRQPGLTDAVMPIIMTGNDADSLKNLKATILKNKMPIIYMVGEDRKPRLLIWTHKTIVARIADDNIKKFKMEAYVDIAAIFDEVVAGGKTAYSLKAIKAMMDADAKDADVKAGTKAPSIRTYSLGFDSSSTQRKGCFVLTQIDISADDIGNEKAYTATRNKIVNSIGANVKEIMDSLTIGKEIDADKMVKKIGRLSLPFTNSGKGAKPTAMAFYTGKFKELGIEFADGFGFISESIIRETLRLHGFKDVKNVCGLGFQNRIVTSKGYTLTVNNTVMRALIWALIAKINPDNVTINNVIRVDIKDSEAVHNIALAIEKGEIKDKIVLVAPKGTGLSEVQYLADANMLKAAFDFDKMLEVSVMEMSHSGSYGTYTSGQILESAITVPYFHDVVMGIGEETIDKIFTMKTESILSHKAVNNFDGFADGPLAKINHDFIFADEAVAKRQIQTMAEAAVNAINNSRFDIDGCYMKALPDLGGFFSQHLLNAGEVYAPDLSKHVGESAMVVRYPHTATSEFVMVKVVGLDELKKRIMAMDTPYTKSLWALVRSIQKGQIILPSISDPVVVAKLGGSDFDGDGVIAITDDRILKMYGHLVEGAVDFKSEAASTKLLYNNFAPEVARLFGLLNGNLDTGEVVNHFYLLRSLLYDINNDAFTEERWIRFIDHILNYKRRIERDMIMKKTQEYGGKYYNSADLLYGHRDADENKIKDLTAIAEAGKKINNTEVNALVASVVDNKISLRYLKNLRKILESLDPAGASVVGRIIDAVKTGEKVTVPFSFLSDFVRNGAKIECAYDKNNHSIIISDQIGFSDDWKYFKYLGLKPIYYVTKNPLYFVKRDLVAYANGKIAEMYSKINAVKPNGKTEGLAGKVGKDMAQLCTALMSAQVKTSLSDVVVPSAELSRYGVSMFRAVTNNYGYRDRYIAAKLCSAIYKEDTIDGFGRFYQTLGAETVLSALNGRDIPIETEIFARENNVTGFEGEEITMTRGMSDKFFAANKITTNGSLIFKDGRTYIVSSLRKMAEDAIATSVAENKVVFKIKVVPGLDNVSGAAMVKLPLREQVERLQRLAGDASSSKNVRYMASYKSVRANNSRAQLSEFDRLVVGDNNFVACYVYDCNFIDEKGVLNSGLSKKLHGRHIKIDHVIMVKVGKKDEGYVFGRIC